MASMITERALAASARLSELSSCITWPFSNLLRLFDLFSWRSPVSPLSTPQMLKKTLASVPAPHTFPVRTWTSYVFSASKIAKAHQEDPRNSHISSDPWLTMKAHSPKMPALRKILSGVFFASVLKHEQFHLSPAPVINHINSYSLLNSQPQW